MSDRTARIRALNDQLRQTGVGGRVSPTAGIAALPAETVAAVVLAVQRFDGFCPDNDPNGEHDFGVLDTPDHRVMFKIDYYDPSLSAHSDNAADPAITARVLTIMLASEYEIGGKHQAAALPLSAPATALGCLAGRRGLRGQPGCSRAPGPAQTASQRSGCAGLVQGRTGIAGCARSAPPGVPG